MDGKQLSHAAFHKKTKMRRLLSYPNQERQWRCKKIGEPLHCSAMLARLGPNASVRPLVPAVAKVAGPCQFGSLPGRSTRDAVAILEHVFERFTSPSNQASRRSCLLAGCLIDLKEAFDTIPRDRLWAAVASVAKLKGLSLVLETGHAGTCYIIRNSLGRPITKVHVKGSVEDPLCFVLLYALSKNHSSTKENPSTRGSLQWFRVQKQRRDWICRTFAF